MIEAPRDPSGVSRQQKMWPGLPFGANTSAVIVLLLVTLIAAQDFYLVDYNSALALKSWWVDASFHITSIDSLSARLQGQGLPLQSASGVDSGFYHFLSYVPAALGCVLFGISPLKSFALIYSPLALFLFAFGIWMLASSCWSKEKALWATVVFLLLPDLMPYLTASHDFLRIKWLISVSPGLGYGVFVSALAWVLCLRGIREGRPGFIALGWLVCLITVLVKAHLFVANALPLVTYTIICYPGLQTRLRFGLLISFLFVYFMVLRIAENHLAVPLIRLDFSNASTYATILTDEFPTLNVTVSWLLQTTSALPPILAPFGLVLTLIFLHFGAFLLLTLFLLRGDMKNSKMGRWIPVLSIFAVYILHAAGLALDTRPYTYQGGPLELIHRPFVWGVSLIMVWTLASLASNYPHILTAGRRWMLCVLLLPLGIYSYHGIQFAPWWPAPTINYSDAYFEAMQYVKTNAEPDELLQVADLDPFLAVKAATGHGAYSERYVLKLYPSKDVQARGEKVQQWLLETDAERITSFASQHYIVWLLARESEIINWSPQLIAEHTRFSKNGVLVMKFLP